MIDLAPHHLETVRRILAEHMPDCEVRAFGSRAKWEGHDYSDLDLAVVCEDEANGRAIERLKEAFEDSDLPIRVDVLDWHAIAEDFRKAIESDCVVVQQAPELASWRDMTVGEFAAFSYGKSLPASRRSTSGPVPVYGSNGVTGYHDSPLTNGPTVIIGRKGTVGALHYSSVPCWPIDTTFFVTGRDAELVRFKYYALVALGLDAMNADSAVPGLNRSDAHAREMCIPDEHEQRAIAGVLGALDDRIQMNRRMSETLEEMARTLFRSWFVDFDPVRAKAEGRPSGLPPDLDSLFPASFEESELGEIPTGWHMRSLGGLCDKSQYGYTQSATDEPIGPKFLRITDINKKSWIEWETVPYCKIGGDDLEKYRLHKGDILIARIADPGHSCMIEKEREAVFASYLIRFRPKLEIYGRFLQYWLQSSAYWNLVTGRAAGTTRVSLNAKVLSEFPVLLPSSSLLEMFGKQVESLRSRVVANAEESHALAAQRDELLPQLLSGKLRVGIAKRPAKATA